MEVSAQNNSYVYCYMPSPLGTDTECEKKVLRIILVLNREKNRRIAAGCSLQLYEDDERRGDVVNHVVNLPAVAQKQPRHK
jgi:hypothetical protein